MPLPNGYFYHFPHRASILEQMKELYSRVHVCQPPRGPGALPVPLPENHPETGMANPCFFVATPNHGDVIRDNETGSPLLFTPKAAADYCARENARIELEAKARFTKNPDLSIDEQAKAAGISVKRMESWLRSWRQDMLNKQGIGQSVHIESGVPALADLQARDALVNSLQAGDASVPTPTPVESAGEAVAKQRGKV